MTWSPSTGFVFDLDDANGACTRAQLGFAFIEGAAAEAAYQEALAVNHAAAVANPPQEPPDAVDGVV